MKSRLNEKTPLINNSNDDVIIQIDSDDDNIERDVISSLNQDTFNQIVNYFSGKYIHVARLAQTSKSIQSKVEHTKEGEKAREAINSEPSELVKWIVRNEDTVIPKMSCSLACILALGNAAVMIFFLPNTINTIEAICIGAPVSVAGFAIFPLGVGRLKEAACTFFSKRMLDQKNKVKMLRSELDEKYARDNKYYAFQSQ